MVCPIVTGSFREWLRDTLETQGVSRRELARRLPGDPESNRRTLRRILSGETNPTDRTREEIEAATASWERDDGRFGRVSSELARIPAAPVPWGRSAR